MNTGRNYQLMYETGKGSCGCGGENPICLGNANPEFVRKLIVDNPSLTL
ncbi:MAG: hypothetical protein U9Q06_00660 [Nanoarchaeota archaeon]|nr:hypothetical protein [Nanoarchaeota archaeon]